MFLSQGGGMMTAILPSLRPDLLSCPPHPPHCRRPTIKSPVIHDLKREAGSLLLLADHPHADEDLGGRPTTSLPLPTTPSPVSTSRGWLASFTRRPIKACHLLAPASEGLGRTASLTLPPANHPPFW